MSLVRRTETPGPIRRNCRTSRDCTKDSTIKTSNYRSRWKTLRDASRERTADTTECETSDFEYYGTFHPKKQCMPGESCLAPKPKSDSPSLGQKSPQEKSCVVKDTCSKPIRPSSCIKTLSKKSSNELNDVRFSPPACPLKRCFSNVEDAKSNPVSKTNVQRGSPRSCLSQSVCKATSNSEHSVSKYRQGSAPLQLETARCATPLFLESRVVVTEKYVMPMLDREQSFTKTASRCTRSRSQPNAGRGSVTEHLGGKPSLLAVQRQMSTCGDYNGSRPDYPGETPCRRPSPWRQIKTPCQECPPDRQHKVIGQPQSVCDPCDTDEFWRQNRGSCSAYSGSFSGAASGSRMSCCSPGPRVPTLGGGSSQGSCGRPPPGPSRPFTTMPNIPLQPFVNIIKLLLMVVGALVLMNKLKEITPTMFPKKRFSPSRGR